MGRLITRNDHSNDLRPMLVKRTNSKEFVVHNHASPECQIHSEESFQVLRELNRYFRRGECFVRHQGVHSCWITCSLKLCS